MEIIGTIRKKEDQTFQWLKFRNSEKAIKISKNLPLCFAIMLKMASSNALSFYRSQNYFEEALNAFKFLGWLKKFGPTQNIFGPVKGQFLQFCSIHKYTCQITIPSILLVNSEFLIIFFAFSQYLNFRKVLTSKT